MLPEALGGGLGALSAFAYAYANQFPKNKQYIVIGGASVAGIVFAKAVGYYAEKRAESRQRFNEEFVRQHPELFPERKVYKYKDKFLPWHSSR